MGVRRDLVAAGVYLAAVCGMLVCAVLAFNMFVTPLPASETSGAGFMSPNPQEMTKLDRWRASKIEQQAAMSKPRNPTPNSAAISDYPVPPYAAMAKKAAKEKVDAERTDRREAPRAHARAQASRPQPTAQIGSATKQAAVDHPLSGPAADYQLSGR